MTNAAAPTPPTGSQISQVIECELGVIPTALVPLKSGAWSSAIAVITDSGDHVLRFSDTEADFRCDAFAAQYANPHLPIPQVQDIGQLDGRWWCLSDRMPGVHLDELDAEAMEHTIPAIARLLIAMRDVPADSTTGYGGWNEQGNGIFTSFADQLMDVGNDIPDARGGGWSRVLSRHDYEQSVFRAGLTDLEHLCTFLPADRHLIHQDTLNYNVTVQKNSISGIFDWGCAMWGDAVYDLAWFRFWMRWYPQWYRLNLPGRLEEAVGIIGDHGPERMRCCLLHIGLMHIRFHAFTGDVEAMRAVAKATEKLLGSESAC